jgi:glutamyl-Q tRNA(Asp) synthetase
MTTPVFRFAPSPNGRLHLGHAASALLNARLAAETRGRLLLRIEDIDSTRCRPAFEAAIRDDLAWLGLAFEPPVWRQSERFACYRLAADELAGRGLLYPCFCSRKEIAALADPAKRDPDGAPLYPGTCRRLPDAETRARIVAGDPHALRLDMPAALAAAGSGLRWREGRPGALARGIEAEPAAWGDAILVRKEFPASYHLAVVVDDFAQAVTHVVRGQDLFHATSLHRLLQALLGFPPPDYHHHALILDQEGGKLSKSLGATGLSELRAAGATPADVRRMVGSVLDAP